MLKLLALITCLCLSFSLHPVQRYQSSVDESKWQVTRSPIHCEMVHEISHYGDGRFVFSSGGELAFQLRVWQAAPKDSVASLHSFAPFWREVYEKELAQLSLSRGNMPVYVGGGLALRMLYELEAGRHPTFHYKDWAGFEDDVYVSISSVNFHQQLDDFRQCISQVLPYGSKNVKDSTVYFEVNKHNLNKSQQKRLNEIALFASIDKGMHIEVSGHADGQGRRIYNKKLSLRRTHAVEKYLKSRGVPEEQISLRAFGETRPVGSNRSDRGRRNNRRVDVVIKRQ